MSGGYSVASANASPTTRSPAPCTNAAPAAPGCSRSQPPASTNTPNSAKPTRKRSTTPNSNTAPTASCASSATNNRASSFGGTASPKTPSAKSTTSRPSKPATPAPWLDPHQLLRDLQRPDTDELDWRRLHLNQWTASRDAWLPTGTWARLRSDTQIPGGADIYLGVDIALLHDTSAVVWAHVLEDGRIALRCHTWSANDKANAHQYVSGGQIRLELIEDFIRQLARDYRIREIAYDPHYFARSAQLLADERFTMVEFLQASGPMAHAYQGFYQACLEGTLTHDGDPVLAAHIDATAADKTERGWKIRKLKSNEHIDACVAAVLAVARARVNMNRGKGPQIFWMES